MLTAEEVVKSLPMLLKDIWDKILCWRGGHRAIQWQGGIGEEEVGVEESREGTDYTWETPVGSETMR
jgi:hypothetical protein